MNGGTNPRRKCKGKTQLVLSSQMTVMYKYHSHETRKLPKNLGTDRLGNKKTD